MNKGYGYALYYPYIHFQNDNWIKTAALYYDGLTRIVPKGFPLLDTSIVKQLSENDFIQNYSPGEEMYDISNDFLDLLEEEYRNPNSRNRLLRTIRHQVDPHGVFSIHDEKIASRVKEALPEFGVTKTDSWYQFHPVAGSLYMTTLAERIAEKKAISLVSDTEGYQEIINALQFEKSDERGRSDVGYQLASLVIKTVVPKNINDVSVNQIITFRDKTEEERSRFYEKTQDLISNIPKIDDSEALQNYISHHVIGIKDQMDGLKGSFLDVKIDCADILLSLSAPPLAIELSNLLPEFKPIITASGIIAAGTVILYKKHREFKRVRNNSPYSYVLSLEQQLAPTSILRRLLKRFK